VEKERLRSGTSEVQQGDPNEQKAVGIAPAYRIYRSTEGTDRAARTGDRIKGPHVRTGSGGGGPKRQGMTNDHRRYSISDRRPPPNKKKIPRHTAGDSNGHEYDDVILIFRASSCVVSVELL